VEKGQAAEVQLFSSDGSSFEVPLCVARTSGYITDTLEHSDNSLVPWPVPGSLLAILIGNTINGYQQQTLLPMPTSNILTAAAANQYSNH
jgi:hypothetical protein